MSYKELVEAYAKRVWDDKDIKAIDELLHDECVIHSLLGDFHGKEFMKKVVQTWLTAFPDLNVINTEIISEQDRVVIHWKAQGSHQGEFKGMKPSGRSVSYEGVSIYRVFQNKITEYWAYLDMEYVINQLK